MAAPFQKMKQNRNAMAQTHKFLNKQKCLNWNSWLKLSKKIHKMFRKFLEFLKIQQL